MKDILIIGLIVLCFGLVVSNIILLEQDTNMQNTTLECNQEEVVSFLESFEENSYYYHLKEMNEIKLKKTTCNPSYYLELPEDRDKLYMTLDYVVKAQDYVLDEYDCTEKAELLVVLLKELGYNRAKTKFVNINCNLWDFSDDYTLEDCESNTGGHLIVQVGSIYFEATSGRVIMPSDYSKYGL